MSKTFKAVSLVLLGILFVLVTIVVAVNSQPEVQAQAAQYHATVATATPVIDVSSGPSLLDLIMVLALYGTLYIGLPLLGLYIIVRVIKSAWSR